MDIIGLLEARGAQVFFHDPYVRSLRHEGLERPAAALRMADLVMIVANHSTMTGHGSGGMRRGLSTRGTLMREMGRVGEMGPLGLSLNSHIPQ